jgi:hypothetical protein
VRIANSRPHHSGGTSHFTQQVLCLLAPHSIYFLYFSTWSVYVCLSFYSLFIYTICIIGIFSLKKKKNFSLNFLFLSFILYTWAIGSLGMNERYFVSKESDQNHIKNVHIKNVHIQNTEFFPCLQRTYFGNGQKPSWGTLYEIVSFYAVICEICMEIVWKISNCNI